MSRFSGEAICRLDCSTMLFLYPIDLTKIVGSQL